MLKEFKEFIARGNVLDLAVGMVIGAAFTAVVKSLVEDILTPILSVLTQGIDFKAWALDLGPVHFAIGNFINAIITFLIVSFAIFMVVKSANRFKKKEEAAAPSTKVCPHCCTEIPLAATRCPHCTSELDA